MIQLVQCLQRLITTLADNYDKNTPFVFKNIDIKDVFWRLAISDTDARKFCYVLPQSKKVENIEYIDVVVPNFLQIGWCESIPFL